MPDEEVEITPPLVKPVDDPVKQLTPIAWFDAATMRALLVAIAGLVGSIAGLFGVNEVLFTQKAAHVIDQGSNLLIAGGVIWALVSRARRPTPPLAATRASAAAKTEAMKAAGILPSVPPPEIP